MLLTSIAYCLLLLCCCCCSDASVTEEQIEEWEVDQPLLQESVAKLKQRLNIKIREQESLAARIRVGRARIATQKKQEKEARMAALRIQRTALMRQNSEEAARPSAPTDLTTQGIEPNPSVYILGA